MKTYNTQNFITDSINTHGNRYDYSKSIFQGRKCKIIIICKIHGDFEQIPKSHVKGSGCHKCANNILTQNQFINLSKNHHGDRYDYSKVIYLTRNKKVLIICKIHGEFNQVADYHLNGSGCPKCAGNVNFTTEEFIERSIIKHGNKFDYSLVDYKNSSKKVKIICKIHGLFYMSPSSHINGDHGCPNCAGRNQTKDDFLRRALIEHENKFDYSLVEFKNLNEKVKIICKIHGIFIQGIGDHLSGKGCKLCGNLKNSLTHEIFVKDSNIIHNYQYDYSKVIYKTGKIKVEIICNIHGSFWQSPNHHRNMKQGCPHCGLDSIRISQEEFLRRANLFHDNKFIYEKTIYTGMWSKIIITCPVHGDFTQVAMDHLNNGCKKCKETTGEKAIRKYLEKSNIKYKTEFKFKDCKYKDPLRFDFAILDENKNIKFLIEFQGVQHYKIINRSSKMSLEDGENNLKLNQYKDEIKRNYCRQNNIPLLEIPYWDKDKIEPILKNFLMNKYHYEN